MKNLVYLCTLKPSFHRTAEESLGLGYLARSLENAGYETIIRDLWLDDTFKYSDLKEEILKNKDKDEKARQVYENLKKWQRHHSKVYDMVIDPISAPKAILVEEMKKYHKLMVMMKKVDLAFMKDTIVCVSEEKNVEDVYNNYEKKYSRFFNDIFATVNELYKKDGLIYEANINGFLLSNKQKS